jgi:arginine/lysine/ornithine decarboxylase
VISALVLSGVVPKYTVLEYNSGWDIAGGVTLSQVDEALKELEKDEKKTGDGLVTPPTYHGTGSNVQGMLMFVISYTFQLQLTWHMVRVPDSTTFQELLKLKLQYFNLQQLSKVVLPLWFRH